MYIKKEPKRITCPICKKSFLTAQPKKIYCSYDCHRIIYRKIRLLKKEKTIPDYAKRRWISLRLRSQKLNQSYCTLEEFRNFWNSIHTCSYCEISEENYKKIFKNQKLQVDRKNPQKGYEIDNIVWACRRCNTMKSNVLSYEEMKEIGHKYLKIKWESITL
jgi:hypothetical protein